MKFGFVTARCALVMACALGFGAPAHAQFWQCAPFARSVSGIQIHGNAHTWWSQAEGRYQRGNRPAEGAVLSFRASGRMRLGHVAMVSKVVSDREVLLTHANWSRRGGVETDVRAVDVSEANDWSMVRVWYGPMHDLGTSANPANGFIYATPPADVPLAAPVIVASNEAPAGPAAVDGPAAPRIPAATAIALAAR